MDTIFPNFELLLFRSTIQIAAILVVVFLLYFRGSGSKDFCFSYVAIGIIVFALCTLLESVKLELGFALGLFAIFGIIRYRTITIPIKEMTYLFVVIGISVINALAGAVIDSLTLAVANGVVLLSLGALEWFVLSDRTRMVLMRYEKIENLRPDRKQELIYDLKERLGIDVTHFETDEVDFLRDTAKLRVYYKWKRKAWEERNVPTNLDSIVFDS